MLDEVPENADVLPVQTQTNLDDVKDSIEGNPVKKKKGGKIMTAVFLAFSLLFTCLALYLFFQGAGAVCHAATLRINGIKTTAEVTQVAAVTTPRRTNSFRESLQYTYYEVVSFQTEDRLDVEGCLPEKSSSDKTYSVGDEVEIYYHPESPARVIDAHINKTLVMNFMSIVTGLLFFFVFSTLNRWLFSTMGMSGPALSAASKVILLLLMAGLFTYQNFHTLYRYLPATQEDACTNLNGVIVREKDGKPFTGRMKSNTERSLSIYSYKDGQLQIDMNFENGIAQGPYKAYYPDGQLQVEDILDNGSYSSQVKMYYEDGTPIEIISPPYTDTSEDLDGSGIIITEIDEEFE